MDKKPAIEMLTKILQDNLGNRITVALANGILMSLSEELDRAAAIAAAMEAGHFGGTLNATVTKGTPDNQVAMP